MFPDDSKLGETNTLPTAFKRKSDLFARFDALARDANAANSAIVDDASFKAEWAKIGAHCVGVPQRLQEARLSHSIPGLRG